MLDVVDNLSMSAERTSISSKSPSLLDSRDNRLLELAELRRSSDIFRRYLSSARCPASAGGGLLSLSKVVFSAGFEPESKVLFGDLWLKVELRRGGAAWLSPSTLSLSKVALLTLVVTLLTLVVALFTLVVVLLPIFSNVALRFELKVALWGRDAVKLRGT